MAAELFFIWTQFLRQKSGVDPTQTDRIVLPLDYIKRRLVNMRDDAKTNSAPTSH